MLSNGYFVEEVTDRKLQERYSLDESGNLWSAGLLGILQDWDVTLLFARDHGRLPHGKWILPENVILGKTAHQMVHSYGLSAIGEMVFATQAEIERHIEFEPKCDESRRIILLLSPVATEANHTKMVFPQLDQSNG
ncbi:MAG: hypothetical protein IPJ66_14970 [Bacteroidetes bacterium]|nr:hypothetical protein [Bacteroidota bacterium]